MMHTSTPSAPRSDFSLVNPPAPMQAQILSMLGELVARLSDASIRGLLAELAVPFDQVQQRARHCGSRARR